MARASWTRIALAAAVVLGVSVPAAAASPAARAAPTTSRSSVQESGLGPLAGVSAASATDAWAVGNVCSHCGGPGTLTLRWNGTAWSKVPSPDPGPRGAVLTGVSTISPTDAWAVGYYGNSSCSTAATVILHWNGDAWSQVKSPDPGAACNDLSGISATSATDVWAVGQYCVHAVNTCHTLILRWNGSAWSQVASPNPGSGGFDPLTSVSAASPTDAWAAGTYCPTSSCSVQKGLFLHWNGTTWSAVPGPSPRPYPYYPAAVSVVSPAGAWAVGESCTSSRCAPAHTLILRWNGATWAKAASPNPGPAGNSLGGVTALSATQAWAGGDYCTTGSCTTRKNLILRWNGTSWAQVKTPDPGGESGENGLDAMDALSPDDVWAAGFTCADMCDTGYDALILHWNGTAWSVAVG